jgi:peptidoglycan/xylan/chitin deacetylase (PgdA/CDA1 family)
VIVQFFSGYRSIAFRLAGFLLAVAAISVPRAAEAVDCAGNPNALGTSRTIIVDPKEHLAVGRMMYPDTLPLEDHEVVLTFDDGPLPKKTNVVLDELARECVKATFFIIGRMAAQFPQLVQRVHAEGHTIGTHTQNHRLKLRRLPLIDVEKEIDEGIASTASAVGSPDAVAPFLRLPGLRFSPEIEDYAKTRGLTIWSSDVVADDWRPISSKQVLARAMARLEQHGRGILLLHDIQKRTAGALPLLLEELKRRRYKVVHVVAAGSQNPKTAAAPKSAIGVSPPAALGK